MHIHFRCTEQEFATIHALAAERQRTIAALLRDAIVGRSQRPADDLIYTLTVIATRLSALGRSLNATPDDLWSVLAEIRAAIRMLAASRKC
jgi:hypothetical protein